MNRGSPLLGRSRALGRFRAPRYVVSWNAWKRPSAQVVSTTFRLGLSRETGLLEAPGAGFPGLPELLEHRALDCPGDGAESALGPPDY